MSIPEKILLDIWHYIVQNYGMTCGVVCIFFALHLLWWERCSVFWRAVRHGIRAIIRCILWPVRILCSTAHTAIKTWQERRKKRRTIAEFDRLYPNLKDQYTEYGKLQFMSYKKMFENLSP